MIRITGSLFAVWGFIALLSGLFIAETVAGGVVLLIVAAVLLMLSGALFYLARREDKWIADLKNSYPCNVGQGGGDIVPGWGSGL